ncbi:MAG: hypothetical protein D6770_03935, partial [Anaerolineae bacterium]
MRGKFFPFFVMAMALALILSACRPATPEATPTSTSAPPPTPTAGGMVQVTGSFHVSNDFVLRVYMVEH